MSIYWPLFSFLSWLPVLRSSRIRTGFGFGFGVYQRHTYTHKRTFSPRSYTRISLCSSVNKFCILLGKKFHTFCKDQTARAFSQTMLAAIREVAETTPVADEFEMIYQLELARANNIMLDPIREVAETTPVADELEIVYQLELARAENTMLDPILEIADTTPINELEMMYQDEIARAKKAQWVLDEQKKENEHRREHIVFEGNKCRPSPIISPLYIRQHLRPSFPYPLIPDRLRDHGPCTRADCPVSEPHLIGVYFHHNFNRAREPWPHTEWFGYSQAPPKVWNAVRRLEEAGEIGKESEEDVKMVTGFRNCHFWEAPEGPPYDQVVERALASWKEKIGKSRAKQPEEQAKQLENQAAEEGNLHLRWAKPLEKPGAEATTPTGKRERLRRLITM